MTRRVDPRAIERQRAGKGRATFSTVTELQAPIGVGGSVPRASAPKKITCGDVLRYPLVDRGAGGGGNRSPRQPRWQDRASRRAREQQLQREPYCEICRDKGRVTEATEVDHRIPRHAGGSLTDPANLRSTCHDCHVELTLADRARRTGRPIRRRPNVKIDPATGYPLPGQDHPWSEPLPEKGK